MDWTKLPEKLQGYRTHIAAGALTLVGVLGLSGRIDESTLLSLGASALGAMGVFLRLAIAGMPQQQQDALYKLLTLWRAASEQASPQPDTPPATAAVRKPLRDISGIAGLLLAMSLCSSAWAGDAMIAGPAAVPAPGYPCRLFIQGDLPAETAIGWDVSPRREGVVQIRPAADGLSADLTTLGGAWRIAVAIHEPGRTIYFRYFDVAVPGQPYTPPPGPMPIPDPQPGPTPQPTPIPDPPAPAPQPPRPPTPGPTPLPAGEFQVAELVAAIVRKIDSPKRGAEAAQLADAAEALAAQVAAGTVPNVTEVLTRIGEGIKGLNSPAWSAAAAQFAATMEQTWKAHSTGRLKLTVTGGLVDKPAWATLLREISTGLRSVK